MSESHPLGDFKIDARFVYILLLELKNRPYSLLRFRTFEMEQRRLLTNSGSFMCCH